MHLNSTANSLRKRQARSSQLVNQVRPSFDPSQNKVWRHAQASYSVKGLFRKRNEQERQWQPIEMTYGIVVIGNKGEEYSSTQTDAKVNHY